MKPRRTLWRGEMVIVEERKDKMVSDLKEVKDKMEEEEENKEMEETEENEEREISSVEGGEHRKMMSGKQEKEEEVVEEKGKMMSDKQEKEEVVEEKGKMMSDKQEKEEEVVEEKGKMMSDKQEKEEEVVEEKGKMMSDKQKEEEVVEEKGKIMSDKQEKEEEVVEEKGEEEEGDEWKEIEENEETKECTKKEREGEEKREGKKEAYVRENMNDQVEMEVSGMRKEREEREERRKSQERENKREEEVGVRKSGEEEEKGMATIEVEEEEDEKEKKDKEGRKEKEKEEQEEKEQKDEEEEECLPIAIIRHLCSQVTGGEESFDWSSHTTPAHFSRFPTSVLHKNNDLRPFLRRSQLVKVIEYTGRLKRLLGNRFCGLLHHPLSEHSTPLVLMLAPDKKMVVGFCVEPVLTSTDLTKDRQCAVSFFKSLLDRNIESLPPGASHIPRRGQVEDTREVAEFLRNISFTPPPLTFGKNELVCVGKVQWRLTVHDRHITYLGVFVQDSDDTEFVVFFQNVCLLDGVEADVLVVEAVHSDVGVLTQPALGDIRIKVIENLSNFEEHFLKMGREGEKAIMIKTTEMEKLFDQFERKHSSKVMLVPKLDIASPFISCLITCDVTNKRLAMLARNKRTSKTETSFRKRISCNPDEIIDGRAKWSTISLLRNKDPSIGRSQTTEHKHEEVLDFDRLNPQRVSVVELEELGNKKAEQQGLVLRVMADLQADTFVALGSARLGEEREERARREREEWEEYKKKYRLVVRKRGRDEEEEGDCKRKKTEAKFKKVSGVSWRRQ